MNAFKKIIFGTALFTAGYLVSNVQNPKPKYLFPFVVPTDKGNLEGMISNSNNFLNPRPDFYIEIGNGVGYIESDAFAKEHQDYLDSIGYSKKREIFIRNHAANNYLHFEGRYRVFDEGKVRPKTSLDY